MEQSPNGFVALRLTQRVSNVRGPAARLVACLAIVAGLLFSGLGRAWARGAVKYEYQHCDPSGDFCEAVYLQGGVRYIAIYASGTKVVRLCVMTPRYEMTCRKLTLQSNGDGSYQLAVRWAAHFPSDGRGRYYVQFKDPDLGLLDPQMSFAITHGVRWHGCRGGYDPTGAYSITDAIWHGIQQEATTCTVARRITGYYTKKTGPSNKLLGKRARIHGFLCVAQTYEGFDNPYVGVRCRTHRRGVAFIASG